MPQPQPPTKTNGGGEKMENFANEEKKNKNVTKRRRKITPKKHMFLI